MKRKLKSLLALALCAVGLAAFAAETVSYLDWDDVNKKMTNAVCTAYTVVKADTATFEAGKTYVVQGTVEQPVHGITVEGTEATPARLILCDGAKLTVTGQSAAETAGLNVSNGTAIVICGQKGGTGVLETTGGAGAAGIGGNAGQAAGTVTIYGGSVTALGKNGAAGIGGGMNKTDTGTVTFGGTGFSVVTGKTATVTAPIAQDDYVNDHGASYVYIEPLQGCEDNPWKVGGTDGTDSVVAWTNGTDKLVIEGAGSVTNLADAVKDGITEITIKVGVTGAADGAFAGFSDVALSLPDGWQGELPNESGNWYGATDVTLTACPLAVRNVTFQQRYPWNGLVDIGFDLTGPEGATNVIVTVRDGETEVTNFAASVTIPEDGVLATNLVWDADAAGLAANFKSDAVTIEVAFVGGSAEPVAVQLWENGPYFATCNVGATKPEEAGYYFWWGDTVGYTHDGEKWVSVKDGATSIQLNNSAPANTLYNKDAAALAEYVDTNGNLKSDYDAAWAHLGEPWRMMTKAEFDSLVANCEVEWTDNWNETGIKGTIVNGKGDYSSNSIFLPAAGWGYESSLNDAGLLGFYWSSTPNSDDSIRAWGPSFNSDEFCWSCYYRYYGQSVRPVRDASVTPVISAKSAAGSLDLTVGDRVAKDVETLVIDPAWGAAATATVIIEGENGPRQYTCASNDLWQTAALEPGRYAMMFSAGEGADEISYSAALWKTGEDWVVFDGSNITENTTFEAGKTYLVLGTNMVNGKTLVVEDGAKFFYDEGAPAGFKAASVAELPKRYEIADGVAPADESNLFQIVEKLRGSEDNPWDVGEGVTTYTNGTELVISGEGTVTDLSEIPADVKGGITAINVTSNGVAGVASDAFQGVGDGEISLTLPDGWQGELPDEGGNWYGATGVTLTAYPLAVKNVQTATHWPWDGKIDITCDLTGSGEVELVVALMTNGVTVCEAMTLSGETTVDLGDGGEKKDMKLVWSAQTDIADANFNASDVRVAVTVTRAAEPIAVQLWEGGPYWAKCNVGATKPEECGYYFWWGDTVGYTNKGSAWISVLDSTKIRFYSSQTPANGTYNKDEATLKSGNWIDDKGNLTATHDAAAKYLDSPWRMPTDAEMQGLTDDSKVSFEWTTKNGVDGCLLTGVTAGYTGRSIFLPAAGYGFGDDFRSSGKYGYYWSATPKLDTDGSNYYAWSIAFNSDGPSRNNTIRSNGLAVRPVRDTALSAPDEGDGFAAVSEAFAFDLRTEVALAEGEVTVSNVTWSATKWGEVPEGTAADIGWTNLTTGAIGVLESGLCGEGAKDVALPKKNGDYRLTHSTGDLTSFVTFTVTDYPTVKIPAAGAHYTYVVSNDTEEVEGELVGDKYEYAVTKGANVKVYFIPEEGYELGGGFSNPMDLGAIDADTVIDVTGMPTATRALTIKNVTTATHWPWDGKIDVTCDLTGMGVVQLAAALLTNGVTLCEAKNITGITAIDLDAVGGVTNGVKFVWDAKADLPANFTCDDVVINVTAGMQKTDGDYMVIDLSADGNGRFAVSYEDMDVASAIEKYNTDEYKTGKLVLKKIPAGTAYPCEPRMSADVTSTPISGTMTPAKDYFIGLFETTAAQYDRVMGVEAPSDATTPKNCISYNMIRGVDDSWDIEPTDPVAAESFMGILAAKTGVAGFDLPTEIQWEIAARAGSTAEYGSYLGEDGSAVAGVYNSSAAPWGNTTNFMWFAKNNNPAGVKSVGLLRPNLWGLYDTAGNVYEFCLDVYNEDKTSWDNVETPEADGDSDKRALRGGYFAKAATISRPSVRASGYSDSDGINIGAGFRLCRTVAAAGSSTSATATSTSGAFAVDLREEIALDSAVRIEGVSHSDTAWGAAAKAAVTLGWTNETTDATGVFDGADDLEDGDPIDVTLPKKNGDYRLTHSTGGLTSFVKFTVTGYPLGSEGNPWTFGDGVTAFSNGVGTVCFKPARGALTRNEFSTVAEAMCSEDFSVKLIAADGSATYDVELVVGASGSIYDSLQEAIEAGEESCSFFEVNGYFVSYDGAGAEGEMTDDTFVPTVPTNLTANAFTAPVGYAFTYWTDGEGNLYVDCQGGVDFARPGETLALTANWTQAETKASGYDELTNLIARATLPVTITLDGDIVLLADGEVVIPEGKSVTFDGSGKFDVSGVETRFGETTVVGEGFAEDDLSRFDAKGVSKAVYEDGKVVLVARGETEEFPWLVGDETGVTAWADPALTNIAAAVIDNGLPAETNTIDLVSLTNDIALCGYEPAVTPLNALVKSEKDGRETFLMPASWSGVNGGTYATLADALAAGETAVVPDFASGAAPAVIAEKGVGADGNTCVAVVSNEDPVGSPHDAVRAVYADGLVDLAAGLMTDITLYVQATTEVTPDEQSSLVIMSTNVMDYAAEPVMDYASLTLYYGDEQQHELDAPIVIHVPRTLDPDHEYVVSRIHEGVVERLPEWTSDAADGSEWYKVDYEAQEILICAKKFSIYSIADIAITAVEVSLPTGVEGCYFVVSNLTDGVEIAPVSSIPGGNTYTLPVGSTIAIYMVPAPDFVVTGTNPYVISPVTPSTTLDMSQLPQITSNTVAVLYPDGDGGVFVPQAKASAYEGVILDESGAVAGTVTVKLGKPSKKGEMTVRAMVKTLADKKIYTFKPETKKVSASVDGPLALELELVGSNNRSKEHTFAFVIEGDSLTGTFDGFTLDGARNVFKGSKDPKRARLEPFVGNWTMALGTETSVVATCCVGIKKTGSISVKGKLDDGTSFSTSVKAEVGDGWIGVPVMVRKVAKGQVKTFAFRVALDETNALVTAVNLAPVKVADKKTGAVASSTDVTAVLAGCPVLTKSEVKAMVFGIEGADAPEKQSVSFNAKTGQLSGLLTWKLVNEKGRKVSTQGKVNGVDIDGVLYGTVFFKKTGEVLPLLTGSN